MWLRREERKLGPQLRESGHDLAKKENLLLALFVSVWKVGCLVPIEIGFGPLGGRSHRGGCSEFPLLLPSLKLAPLASPFWVLEEGWLRRQVRSETAQPHASLCLFVYLCVYVSASLWVCVTLCLCVLLLLMSLHLSISLIQHFYISVSLFFCIS